MRKEMMSVDPGVTGTGVAFWREQKLVCASTLYPLVPVSPWEEKLKSVCEQFEEVCVEAVGLEVFIEQPAFMRGVGGRVVAEAGDLVKLSILVGSLFRVASSFGHNVKLVPVSVWKGQLPKKVAIQRIKKILANPGLKMSEHAWDAVGIGLWAQGRF